MKVKIREAFLLLLCLSFFTGCGKEEAPLEIIHFSNHGGDFEISAPSDFEYNEGSGAGVDDMLALGKADGTAVIILLQFYKSDYMFDDLTAFAGFCEEVALGSGVGVLDTVEEAEIYEGYTAEGALDASLKRMTIGSGKNSGNLLLGYLEYPGKYYFLQVYYLKNPKDGVPDYIMDIPYSFREGRNALDEGVIKVDMEPGVYLDTAGRYRFSYNPEWTYTQGKNGEGVLTPPDGNAVVVTNAMEEDLDGMSIMEYMDVVQEEMRQIYGVFYGIGQIETMISGRTARILYIETLDHIWARQLCVLDGDMVYMLSYQANGEFYDMYLEDVEAMEQSFEILE